MLKAFKSEVKIGNSSPGQIKVSVISPPHGLGSCVYSIVRFVKLNNDNNNNIILKFLK